ncbi:MAG: hypothetical protein IJA75_03255 [Oscillospiraceae bacterium]|nr:hypothetical protein [Oscillospiraceae bacterium]
MTEIMPFPENNYETVLLDRPERVFYLAKKRGRDSNYQIRHSGGLSIDPVQPGSTPSIIFPRGRLL